MNRKLQAGTHTEGLRYAETAYFYATQRTADEIIGVLTDSLGQRTRPPLVGPEETYLESSSTNQVIWGHGNSITTAFRAVATVIAAAPEEDPQEAGVRFEFVDVMSREGIFAEVSAMRALKHDVYAALRTLDPKITETPRS